MRKSQVVFYTFLKNQLIMKKFLFLAALFCSCSALCQTTDETAIKNLLLREATAYQASDWKTWSDCWMQESYISWSANVRTGYAQVSGWEGLAKYMRPNLDSPSEPWAVTISQKRWSLRINGNMALATFIQVVTDYSTHFSYTSSETRSCERKGLDWKIIHAGSLREAPNYYALTRLIQALAYAALKDETPEMYAQAVFNWTKNTVLMEPLTLPAFTEWIREWASGYHLQPEVLNASDKLVQIRRINMEESEELAGFFQNWNGQGAAVERFYRELWRLELQAANLTYEAKDEGDKTIETFRKK